MPLARRPGPPLDRFVKFLWYFEDWAPPHSRERRLPSGALELVISLRRDRIRVFDDGLKRERWFDAAVLSGPRSDAVIIDTSVMNTLVGVVFRPGAARAFFRQPASEFRGRHVSLSDALGGAALKERLIEARSPVDTLVTLEAWLAEMLRHTTHDPAIAWATREFSLRPHQRIADVTGRIGFSARTFIQRFEDVVGLTPKMFCRVQRFQSALRRMHGGADIPLGDLALACGYFDQAHFAHDFREFSGVTPSTYLSLRTPFQNHIPLVD